MAKSDLERVWLRLLDEYVVDVTGLSHRQQKALAEANGEGVAMRMYAVYDSDERVSGPDDFDAFETAFNAVVGPRLSQGRV